MDTPLLLMINHGLAHPLSDMFFYWISQRVTFTLPLLLIILALLWRSFGRNGVKLLGLLLLMIILGDQLGGLLKDIIRHPRPCAVLFEIINQPYKTQGVSCGAMTTGMPSSHALNFFLTATFLGSVLGSWRWAIPLLVIATLVGISRIYLGAHYPSQILAGSIIGLTFGLLAALITIKYIPFVKQLKKQTPQSKTIIDGNEVKK